MAKVQMKAYKVKEIVFHNNIQGKQQLNLSNKVSHNVKYSQNGMCEGVLTVEMFDKAKPDVLNIKVTVSGVFQILQQTEKEFLHVDTFKELFPFAKATVSTVSASSAASGSPAGAAASARTFSISSVRRSIWALASAILSHQG